MRGTRGIILYRVPKEEVHGRRGNVKTAAGFLAVIVILILVVIGVSSKHSSRNRQPKKEFGRIYRAEDGVTTRAATTARVSPLGVHQRRRCSRRRNLGSLSTGTWFRVSSPLGNVGDFQGRRRGRWQAYGVVEEESAATNNEEITESTTESEATAWIRQ